MAARVPSAIALGLLAGAVAACRSAPEHRSPTPAAAAAAEASAPRPDGAEVRLADGAAPAFAADANAILAELEEWRGLPFLRDVVVEIAPQADVADDKLNGWYEPQTKRLVVVEGRTDAVSRGTLLHEMFHALQDQHFDLARLHRDVRDAGPDAQRALQALIEGEAMLAVSELMDYDFERHAHLPEDGPIDPARFEKIFHYGAGLRYARALRERGGWEEVDAAFARPPRTTAEILHPERGHPERRNPEREPAAPAPPPAPAGATGPGEPRGEYALYLLLARSEELRPRAAELAARWTADRAYPAGDGTLWVIAVDDVEAAKAIELAAREHAGARRVLVEPGTDGALVTLHLAE
jgi:hypothetical protein